MPEGSGGGMWLVMALASLLTVRSSSEPAPEFVPNSPLRPPDVTPLSMGSGPFSYSEAVSSCGFDGRTLCHSKDLIWRQQPTANWHRWTPVLDQPSAWLWGSAPNQERRLGTTSQAPWTPPPADVDPIVLCCSRASRFWRIRATGHCQTLEGVPAEVPLALTELQLLPTPTATEPLPQNAVPFASSVSEAQYGAASVVDGSVSSQWRSSGQECEGQWVALAFDTAVEVAGARFTAASRLNMPTEITLECSNDPTAADWMFVGSSKTANKQQAELLVTRCLQLNFWLRSAVIHFCSPACRRWCAVQVHFEASPRACLQLVMSPASGGQQADFVFSDGQIGTYDWSSKVSSLRSSGRLSPSALTAVSACAELVRTAAGCLYYIQLSHQHTAAGYAAWTGLLVSACSLCWCRLW